MRNDIYKDSNDPYKSEADYAALEAEPLMGQPIAVPSASNDRNNFPGNRRNVLPCAAGPPVGSVFVKTAGNALQAVPRSVLQQQDQLVAVTVPENMKPGDVIYVQHNNINHGQQNQEQYESQLMQATIPAGALPGHTFFVQVPNTKEEPVVAVTGEAVGAAGASVVVAGQDAAGDLFLREEQQQKDQSNLV